jgi:hypothetical protein
MDLCRCAKRSPKQGPGFEAKFTGHQGFNIKIWVKILPSTKSGNGTGICDELANDGNWT